MCPHFMDKEIKQVYPGRVGQAIQTLKKKNVKEKEEFISGKDLVSRETKLSTKVSQRRDNIHCELERSLFS